MLSLATDPTGRALLQRYARRPGDLALAGAIGDRMLEIGYTEEQVARWRWRADDECRAYRTIKARRARQRWIREHALMLAEYFSQRKYYLV